jgi:hypothetical protein
VRFEHRDVAVRHVRDRGDLGDALGAVARGQAQQRVRAAGALRRTELDLGLIGEIEREEFDALENVRQLTSTS